MAKFFRFEIKTDTPLVGDVRGLKFEFKLSITLDNEADLNKLIAGGIIAIEDPETKKIIGHVTVIDKPPLE